MKLDLQEFKTEGSWVFSGRPRGEKVREIKHLAAVDTTDEHVDVHIPQEILGLNPSFFLGLFGPSVRRFGKEAFEQKFQFHCNPAVLTDIRDGINQALKESNPLAK